MQYVFVNGDRLVVQVLGWTKNTCGWLVPNHIARFHALREFTYLFHEACVLV